MKWKTFKAADAISAIENPLTWTPEKSQLFVDACRELATFHRDSCPDIAKLYQKRGFSPESLKTEADLASLPFIGVQAMKYFLLLSQPESEAKLKLTSSGTRGQKTQIWFDDTSLARVMKMLEVLWTEQGMVSSEPTNYLMMIYDPEQAGDSGITFSIANQQRFAPVAESYFAIKKNHAGDWHLDIESLLATLDRFEKEGHALRIHGIPFFIFDLIEHLESRGRTFSFPTNSLVVTGGGWKAAEGRKVSREEFRSRLHKCLGILPERIIDGYGMAEHSAPYNECGHHRFHIPAFCRIYARDPVTLRVLPEGQAGLLELITPFNTMMPNLAILATDVGMVDPDPCTCSFNSPTFTLLGRGGLVKHKGCAITASEIVKREK